MPADVFSELPSLQRLHLSGNPGYPLFEPTTTTIAEGPRTAVPITSGLDPSFPYRLATPGPVRLAIYSVLGQPVRTLVDHVQAAGVYQASWDARDQQGATVAAGVYWTCLHYPGGKQTRRVLHLK